MPERASWRAMVVRSTRRRPDGLAGGETTRSTRRADAMRHRSSQRGDRTGSRKRTINQIMSPSPAASFVCTSPSRRRARVLSKATVYRIRTLFPCCRTREARPKPAPPPNRNARVWDCCCAAWYVAAAGISYRRARPRPVRGKINCTSAG